MARTKGTRRTRTAHPGVKLRRRTLPDGRVVHRARWIDPTTGREREQTLDGALGLTSAEARRRWAIEKAELLARDKADHAMGKTKPAEMRLSEAVLGFFEEAAHRLRPSTLAWYRSTAVIFEAWAEHSGIRQVTQLRPEHLTAFKEARVKATHKKPRKGCGVGRGARVNTRQKRSPQAINGELRALGVIVHQWRRLGLTPHLTRDDIADRLARLREPRPQPQPLRQSEVEALLNAALRHDRATFQLTRAEKAGSGAVGSTLKHESIAPLTAFLLLSGCRLGEALALRWDQVDLDAPAPDGSPMGLIALGTETKTSRPRQICFDVSPTLRTLLAALRLQAGDRRFVFGGEAPLPKHHADAARKRLLGEYGAPEFTWQRLRQTTGAYLTNAPGIFAGASAYQSAARLGHSVTVAERYYIDAVRGIPREARTLEAAMTIENLMVCVLGKAGPITPDAARFDVPEMVSTHG